MSSHSPLDPKVSRHPARSVSALGLVAGAFALAVGLTACNDAGVVAGNRAPPPASDEYDPATARALAIQSMKLPDPLAAVIALEQATRMAPSVVDGWLLLAGRRAESGDADGAFAALENLIVLGVRAPIDAYPPLQTLQADERWAPLVAKLDAAVAPSGASEVLFELEPKDLLTEGIAHDPQVGAWYVSAVHGRKIVRIDPDHVITDFLTGDDVWGVFGMAIDAQRRRLWAATAAIGQMRDYEPADDGRSALLQVDLESGEVVGRYLLPNGGASDPQSHRLGDVVVAGDGSVYASDAAPPGGIYHLEPGGSELQRVGGNLLLNSPQGLAFLDSDRMLLVADYSLGLVALDLASGAGWPVEPPKDLWLQALDGLATAGPDQLVAIQNGGYPPHRVLRLQLSTDRRRIERWSVAAAALPEWSEPTLGTVVQDQGASRFVYVAASQWPLFPEGGAPDLSQLQAPKIMSLDLVDAGDSP